MRLLKFFLGLIAILTLFNSCTGCVKKISKKVTETTVAAVEGVTEVLDENAEKLGESTGSIAIKVLKGAGKALNKELSVHAKEIESKNGVIVLTNIDNIDVKQLNSYYNKIAYEQDVANGVSVKYVGRLDSFSVFDSYVSFTKIGIYDCNIIISNNTNKDFAKNTLIQIDSVPQNMIISFSEVGLKLFDTEDLYFKVIINEIK